MTPSAWARSTACARSRYSSGLAVGGERGTGEEQRTLGVEGGDFDGWRHAGGSAEGHQQAARTQAVQGCLEGSATDGVVDHIDLAPGGQIGDLGGETGRVEHQHLVAAGSPGPFDTFRLRHHADHPGAQVPGPGRHQLADGARRAVQQDACAGPDGVGGVQQVVRGDALEQQRRRVLESECVGQLQQALGGVEPGAGIGAQRAGGIGDAVARRQSGDSRTQRGDHSGAFQAEAGRQRNRYRSSAGRGPAD